MNAGDKKALHVSILKNFSQIHFVCLCEILKCGYVANNVSMSTQFWHCDLTIYRI